MQLNTSSGTGRVRWRYLAHSSQGGHSTTAHAFLVREYWSGIRGQSSRCDRLVPGPPTNAPVL